MMIRCGSYAHNIAVEAVCLSFVCYPVLTGALCVTKEGCGVRVWCSGVSLGAHGGCAMMVLSCGMMRCVWRNGSVGFGDWVYRGNTLGC